MDIAGALFHYSDVPELAALLSNVRLYVFSYPWIAFYPAFVFLIAILGFNLFGEGVRRMVVGVGVRINRFVDGLIFSIATVAFGRNRWVQGSNGAPSLV